MVKTIGKKEITESILLTPITAPTGETGKLYFDSGSSVLKIYDGAAFRNVVNLNSSGVIANDIVGGIEPATNGAKSVGNTTKGMAYVYLKDTANSNVYRIEVVSGVLQATLI